MDPAGLLGKSPAWQSIAAGRPNAHVGGAATTQDPDMTVSHGGLDAAVLADDGRFARITGFFGELQSDTAE